tara:strand:- start:96 stop:344 length:249 start_codon:yes stop_codon:yes gene_type:complete
MCPDSARSSRESGQKIIILPPGGFGRATKIFFGCSPARETPHPRPPAREISAKRARDPKLKKMDIRGIKRLDIFASFCAVIS